MFFGRHFGLSLLMALKAPFRHALHPGRKMASGLIFTMQVLSN
jgi:hypothetical protein